MNAKLFRIQNTNDAELKAQHTAQLHELKMKQHELEQTVIEKEKLITQLQEKSTAQKITIEELTNQNKRISDTSLANEHRYQTAKVELEQTRKEMKIKQSDDLRHMETQNMYKYVKFLVQICFSKMIENLKTEYESKLQESRKCSDKYHAFL